VETRSRHTPEGFEFHPPQDLAAACPVPCLTLLFFGKDRGLPEAAETGDRRDKQAR
jgi:hypothetical protein